MPDAVPVLSTMAAVAREFGRRHLMRPRGHHTPIAESLHQVRIRPVRPRSGPCPARRQVGDVAQRVLVGRRAVDRASQQLAAEIRPRIRHLGPSRMSPKSPRM
ncbi:hypothetical protein MHIP_59660 [Mycolicibacterium hippocampi]|uniref:Uncharacterized protein n=1 Tax=Mycolicibacterium hippocampi TaxID=659824 RepID=A0A7I9ZXH6_9MYCO|nr:hypothetical protein MHIP_59660 [Mycolicibacterium hippocampi]